MKLISKAPGPFLVIMLLFSVLSPYGCKRSAYDGMGEGKIVYEVELEGGEQMNPMMKAMVPGEAVCFFTKNATSMVLNGPMGIMEMRFISDASAYTYTAVVSAMGKKAAMVFDKEKINASYGQRPRLQMDFTNETRQIAGVECRKVIVTDSTNHTYPVYFTDELNIKEPNWSTPFREIDGMLMEFSMNLGGMKLKMKAREISGGKPTPDLFQIPEGYEIISNPEELKSWM